MDFKEWFSKLSDDTKLWLVQNMGQPLPADIGSQIVAAGGPSALSASDADWIERINNGDDVGV
ncbi:MAG: hypothetical protein JWN80_271 [Microbacteriaceae bacterium]|jgi:hypothetical protein|nr:hypothetical protein [Microbacteriaceae bacterium]